MKNFDFRYATLWVATLLALPWLFKFFDWYMRWVYAK